MAKRTGPFDLQGHRGARGLKPENTLPSFESAFDSGVTTVETDLHLTRDGIPVLMHDHFVGAKIYRRISPASPEVPPSETQPWVSQLTLSQLRAFRGDRNPDPKRFPAQDAGITPLAAWFADSRGLDPYAIPTLTDLFDFAGAYAGDPGRHVGKTDRQRDQARNVQFDLELKRVPFHPERMGDDFAGTTAGLLEERVLEAVQQASVLGRAIIRSFDHRSLRAVRSLAPELVTGVLVAGTAPVEPAQISLAAQAQVYCPDYQFLDEVQVCQLHAAGIRVVPWTVNEPADWAKLYAWGVDGITTDYPDRLGEWLRTKALTNCQ